MEAIGSWWDGVELWVIGLPFALQILVVMAVLIPLATLVAICLDTVLTRLFILAGRGDEESGRAPRPWRRGSRRRDSTARVDVEGGL